MHTFLADKPKNIASIFRRQTFKKKSGTLLEPITFHSRTTTSAWVSNSSTRPSESVTAASDPLGERVNFSPFLGLSFKQVKGDAT